MIHNSFNLKMLKKYYNVCDLCGDNTTKSYLNFSKLPQSHSRNITKKICSVLMLQDAVDMIDFKNICLNCFERINSLFDSLTEIKNIYLTTQSLLRDFLEEKNEEDWLKYRKSQTISCSSSEIDSNKTENIVESTEVKEEEDSPRSEILTEPNMLKNEYTDPEWLSEIENLSDTLEEKIEPNIEINYSIQKKVNTNGNIISTLNNTQTDKIMCKDNTRVNKRGLVYISASDVHVFLNNNGNYECNLCKVTFKWRHTAEHHVRSQHTKEKPFKCPICKKGFTASHYLNRHVTCVHEKEKFGCQQCGQLFPRRYILVAHMKIHGGPPSLSCPYNNCLKKFYAKHVLKAHIINSHAAKDLICDQCGKKFRTTAQLMNHRQRHEEKSMKCPYCPKLFSVKTDLFVHMKYHKEALPWRCGACNMFFKTTRGLQNHFAISHGERVSRLDLYMLYNSSQKKLTLK